MVQEFVVLRCYSCETFQVHQVKKAPKWDCKVCGEKQSRKKVYGQGKAIDCRKHVQKLNILRGRANDQGNSIGDEDDCEDGGFDSVARRNDSQGDKDASSEQDEYTDLMGSRWSKYMPTKKPDSLEEDEAEGAGFQVTTERVEFDEAVSKVRRFERVGPMRKKPMRKRPHALSESGWEQKTSHVHQSQSQQESGNACKNSQGLVSHSGDESWMSGKSDNFGKEARKRTSSESAEESLKTPCPTRSTMAESLPRQSKWSKFLSAPASDVNEQPNDKDFCLLGSSTQANFRSGQKNCLSVQASKEEIPSSGTQLKSAKYDSIFSISESCLEGEWLSD